MIYKTVSSNENHRFLCNLLILVELQRILTKKTPNYILYINYILLFLIILLHIVKIFYTSLKPGGYENYILLPPTPRNPDKSQSKLTQI